LLIFIRWFASLHTLRVIQIRALSMTKSVKRLHALVRFIRMPRHRWLLDIRFVRRLGPSWPAGIKDGNEARAAVAVWHGPHQQVLLDGTAAVRGICWRRRSSGST
jgi:hypothetical protein